MEALAPELLPMLVSLEPHSNFVPVTNNLLAELQRRGVSRDDLISVLQDLGKELPAGSLELLHLARKGDVDVKVLSDANSVFINHILSGAKAGGLVHEVITNQAAFERVNNMDDACGPAGPLLGGARKGAAGHRLVIAEHHDDARGAPEGPPQAPHNCPLCPRNLCKGLEVARLQAKGEHRNIVFCGDGANDVCAALSLGPGDHVLARRGHSLADYLQEAATKPGMQQATASVQLWSSHDELCRLVGAILAGPS